MAANLVESVAGIEVPGFQAMFQDLKRGTFHLSTSWVEIPDQYLETMPVPRIAIAVPGAATVSTVSSTATGVSSLTHATPTETRASVNRIDNPTRDADFTSITIRPGGTRNILRTQPPPANDAGHEFCVA